MSNHYNYLRSSSITNPPALVEKVNKMISEGREPIGGISTIGSRYMQAILFKGE